MSPRLLSTETGCILPQLVIAATAERGNMRVHTQLTANDDAEIAYRVDDYNQVGQQRDISDGDLC